MSFPLESAARKVQAVATQTYGDVRQAVRSLARRASQADLGRVARDAVVAADGAATALHDQVASAVSARIASASSRAPRSDLSSADQSAVAACIALVAVLLVYKAEGVLMRLVFLSVLVGALAWLALPEIPRIKRAICQQCQADPATACCPCSGPA